jgi:hypothetical protein
MEWGQAAKEMRITLRIFAGLAVLAAMPWPAAAQRAARHISPGGAQVVRAGQPLDPNFIRAADVPFVSSINPANTTVSTLINGAYPVPGFGFDYTHHAAVNRNLAVRAIIDPATQHQLALARDLRRDLGRGSGGFPTALPFINNTNVNQIFITLPPPVVIVQQPTVIEVPVERAENLQQNLEPPRPPAPVSELGELVFIRRDGTLVLAVGFSVVNGRIVYVTRDGIRRSFPLADLDLESTQVMNEERGTSLRL